MVSVKQLSNKAIKSPSPLSLPIRINADVVEVESFKLYLGLFGLLGAVDVDDGLRWYDTKWSEF